MAEYLRVSRSDRSAMNFHRTITACVPGLLLWAWLLHPSSGIAQDLHIERIDPPNWWTDMRHHELQLLVHGPGIGSADTVRIPDPSILLKKVGRAENPNYLFLDIAVDTAAAPTDYDIHFEKGGKQLSWSYELRSRRYAENEHQGFDASDVIYLLMPDRFANGDTANDAYDFMQDELDRSEQLKRHGGDLQGVIDHLDYFNELGVTALWLNPVQENRMPKESYHGYAITDMYNIDRRLGDLELYRELVEEAHAKGLKVIMDMVVNHIGTNNYLVLDPPAAGWFHTFPEFTRTNYRGVAQVDPYASEADRTLMNTGWFDRTMADLDQSDPRVAAYLVQCTLWWIEYAGLDGIRMDTYSYPDKDFLADWAQAVFREYPEFNIVGEVWENRAATQAFWLNGANPDGQYDSGIRSLTDFVLRDALITALNEEENWDKGLARIYYTLTEDRLYPGPNEMVTFLDNHDIPRCFSAVGQDLAKMKMGIAALLTLRGIPQLYYGSELGFTGYSHGEVRPEMYGGWSDHRKNAFTGQGLDSLESALLEYTRRLLHWRQGKPVVQQGGLMHFIPEDGVYVYFRYNTAECVMVAFNRGAGISSLDLDRFRERLDGYTRAVDVLTGRVHQLDDRLDLPPATVTILELE